MSLIVLLASMCFWGTISNFVYTHSYASVNSRLNSVFAFSEEGHKMCLKRLKFK